MTDPFMLLGLLLLIVAVMVYMCWRLDLDVRDNIRYGRLGVERDLRVFEDACWLGREQAYKRAMELALIRANLVTVEQLVDALDGGRRLEAVQ